MAYSKAQKDKIFEFVCGKIAEDGVSLRSVTRDYKTIPHGKKEIKMPNLATFMRWLTGQTKECEHYRAQYTFAMTCREEVIFDDLISIADNDADVWHDENGNKRIDSAAVSKKTLQSRNRMWVLARMNPKKYSDRQKIEHELPQEIKPIELVLPPAPKKKQ